MKRTKKIHSDNSNIEAGENLLKLIEKEHGRFRLDIEPYATFHGDDHWGKKVFGEVYSQFRPSLINHKLDMFNCPVIVMLREAALKLIDEDPDSTANIPIGWTSAPILNACAIKGGNAIAIAVNVRLSNALYVANGLNFQLEEQKRNKDSDSVKNYLNNIKKVVRNSSDLDFDSIMYEVEPFPSRFYTWMASQLTYVQMLFVVLHEYAHLLLGHLDNAELWKGYPIRNSHTAFFRAM